MGKNEDLDPDPQIFHSLDPDPECMQIRNPATVQTYLFLIFKNLDIFERKPNLFFLHL
jgi:hypothetical protein